MTALTAADPADTVTDLPLLLAEVEVVSVERLSPTFLRLELGGAGLADFGVDGPLYDQRFKLVVPHEGGGLTSVEGADEGWLSTWMERPVEERGHMRTYTVREVRGTGTDTRIVVDFALHDAGDHGEIGPGAGWGAQARPGDRAVVVAPRRGHPFGGIEFVPPAGHRLLLVGDETAVPAISAILECLPHDARGAAYLEVPVDGDILDLRHPDGVEITWLPRNGATWGERLTPAVVDHLGAPLPDDPAVGWLPAEDEVDPDLWETPTYSSSGEEIAPVEAGHLPQAADKHRLDGLYAWIAGEAAVVTGLRRHLVRELGMDRSQVAFMGYWRRGISMKS
ncbi:siderophore-interacting protein [Nocardioides gansuensis]|uniref:Siderophore-interacting protein n=1 Tax=Nocardioides gansuensis TaxID=2138300 RepID=A0A2T8FF37_9ACTN|nr:siderophore-interacting protein [Nocardioides gansuensis]PVG84323.1 siderophore-interacting protein [Nocardioides gansuensis]